jgi:hypothetical protein
VPPKTSSYYGRFQQPMWHCQETVNPQHQLMPISFNCVVSITNAIQSINAGLGAMYGPSILHTPLVPVYRRSWMNLRTLRIKAFVQAGVWFLTLAFMKGKINDTGHSKRRWKKIVSFFSNKKTLYQILGQIYFFFRPTTLYGISTFPPDHARPICPSQTMSNYSHPIC